MTQIKCLAFAMLITPMVACTVTDTTETTEQSKYGAHVTTHSASAQTYQETGVLSWEFYVATGGVATTVGLSSDGEVVYEQRTESIGTDAAPVIETQILTPPSRTLRIIDGRAEVISDSGNPRIDQLALRLQEDSPGMLAEEEAAPYCAVAQYAECAFSFLECAAAAAACTAAGAATGSVGWWICSAGVVGTCGGAGVDCNWIFNEYGSSSGC